MAICPECKQEIVSLKTEMTMIEYGDFSVVNGNSCYDEFGMMSLVKISFICPECKKELFDNKEKAEAFLRMS